MLLMLMFLSLFLSIPPSLSLLHSMFFPPPLVLSISLFTRFSYARVDDIFTGASIHVYEAEEIWSMQRLCDKLDRIQENNSIRKTERKVKIFIFHLILFVCQTISTTLVGRQRSGNTRTHTHCITFPHLCVLYIVYICIVSIFLINKAN